MISDKIKHARIEHGLTQQELADLLHVSRTLVSKWETGQGMPDDAASVSLVEILGISSEELFCVDNKSPNAHRRHSVVIGICIFFAVVLVFCLITINQKKAFGFSSAKEIKEIGICEYSARNSDYSLRITSEEEIDALFSGVCLCKKSHSKSDSELELFPLFSMQVNCGEYPYTYLHVYRCGYDYLICEDGGTEYYIADKRLLETVDKILESYNQNHISYYSIYESNFTNMDAGASIPIELRCSDDLPVGSLTICYGIYDNGIITPKSYCTFYNTSNDGSCHQLKANSIYYPEVFYASENKWINETEMQALSISIKAYGENGRTVGSTLVPVFSLNDCYVSCTLCVDEYGDIVAQLSYSQIQSIPFSHHDTIVS